VVKVGDCCWTDKNYKKVSQEKMHKSTAVQCGVVRYKVIGLHIFLPQLTGNTLCKMNYLQS